uniref:Methyltransferase domain-containing protein n=1 Tax=Bionectria ochroleuca TaxID=29856 RepID=A0A8H7N6P6_BIOOC
MATDYEKQSYWHDRFASETSFEWLVTSKQFISVIESHLARLPLASHILHLGSGTSDLHNHFRSRGLLNVTNLDFEPLAAERGRDLEQNAFGDVRMNYVVADATRLVDEPIMVGSHGGAAGEEEKNVTPAKFELVVDKSTADAVACGGDSAILKLAKGIKECLSKDGVWISLSFSSDRFEVLELPFHVEVMAKVPTRKVKPTDPDIYHRCFILRPM